MEKITVHTGTAAPLRQSNVDTDQIIPGEFLKRISRTGYDDAVFYEWRQDPDFVLNQPQYKGVSILVAGPEFGTGSSREHAVWGLVDYGFKVVVSSRFADIFRGNSGKNGLVTAQVDQEVVDALWARIEADPTTQITVDLEACEIRTGDLVAPFQIDEYVRWRFLEGLDDIGITLRHEADITAFEAKRPAFMPTTGSTGV